MIAADSRAYSQLWRLTDGAVRDAFSKHPDYLTNKGKDSARRSVVKRVAGAIMGYTTQVVQSRSGVRPAADNVSSGVTPDGDIQGAAYDADGTRERLQGPPRDAAAILHDEIERAMALPQARDGKGRFLAKPTPQSFIRDALRAQYGAYQSAAALVPDAEPSRATPASELHEEVAADTRFYNAMCVLHGVVATACFAIAFTLPDVPIMCRAILVAMGLLCGWCAYRCLP